MERIAKTRTQQILKILLVMTWVVFIGFMIEAGAVLFSYTISLVNPDAARNFYRGLDLYSLSQSNFWYYTQSVSFMLALSVMKSYVSYLLIKTLSKFNLQNPFSIEVARHLEKISYYAFGTWIVTMLSNAHIAWLEKLTGEIYVNPISGEFIFMVGLIYVISQVFKRGVEIQAENELTI